MRTLKIPFCDIAYFEKTRLQHPDEDMLTIVNGSQSIYIRNPAGISTNDFLVLEAFESEDAEIVQVAFVDSQMHLVELVNPTYIDHAVGVLIIKTPYDKLRIYKGTSVDVSTHTEITIAPYEPLRPDNAYTYYIDSTGWLSSLSANITSSAESMIVANAADCPATPFTVFCGGEQIRVTAVSGNTLTISRAYNSTTATGHLIGAPVFSHYYSYAYYNSALNTTGNKVLYADSNYDSILTVTNLKNWFMFGLDLTDDDGYPFPNSMFEFAIRAAVRSLEKTLQVKLIQEQIIDETHDYYMVEYKDFAFLQLLQYPILSVERVAIRYPTSTSDVVFPNEWIQLQRAHGQIHLIPTSGSISQILMGTGGDYLNFVWRGWTFMPNLWHIDYTAGFATGTVPEDIIGVIGKMACFYPLNIAGDLVGGIAIASKSIGIDGLSQSINTTSCVHPDALVYTNNEYKRISEVGVPTKLWEGYLISFCVEGKNTNPVSITPDHLISTRRGWVEAKELNFSDEIDQGGGIFKNIKKIDDFYFKGQLYDMVNQPDEKYVTFQGVIHNSPENAGYSARLRQYERELKIEVPRLIAFYKGIRFTTA